MFISLLIVHVLVAISLVFIVLLQTGRGAELGAAFGGTGQVSYGRTQGNFMTRATTSIAVIFMATSLSLAFISTERPAGSILSDVASPVSTQAESTAAEQAQQVPPAESEPVADPTASSTGEQNPTSVPVLPQSEAPAQPTNPTKQ